MRTISCKLEDLKNMTLHIGYEGENDYTSVRIDAGSVFAEYPEAVATMKVQPPKGNMYPVIVSREGDIVVWNVKDSDTASNGNGEIQLTFTEGTVVRKSCTGKTIVHRSLKATGPAPDPVQEWVDHAEDVLEEVEAAEIHQPIIGLDGYWYTWNQETGEYEKTNTKAHGADGHSPVLTSSKDGKTTTIYADGTQLAQIQDGEDGQGADVIDDTAGEGDTDKTWSADKLDGELTDVKNAIHGMNTATAGDVGKALSPKTVTDGKVTEWQFVNGGSDDPAVIEQKVNAWLNENITNPDSPPLDRSLSSGSAAAPADLVGDIAKLKGHAVLSGTYSGTQYKSVSKTFPAGKYHLSIASITSSDTNATTCRFVFADGGNSIWEEQFNRGVAISVDVELESQATAILLYASNSYPNGSGDTFEFTSIDITESYDMIDKINGIEKDIDDLSEKLPVFGDYQIKTLKVLDSFTLNHKSYTFATGANITNYASYGTTDNAYCNTPPIRIRNKDGKLIYNNLHITPKTATTPAVWTFDIDGKYLRTVTFTGMESRETPFLSDEYYAILNEFPTVSGYTETHWLVSPYDIEWLNSKHEYTVGADGDFTTFTDMLIALANDKSEKTVYIKSGTYDIFTEMGGAEYIAEVSPSASELEWTDVCHVVPPNTTIIGLGNVVLSWEPTAEQMINERTAFLFSPLNVMGNCTIENISVVAKNCRYTVHDETMGLPENDGARHHYKNCHFTLLEGSYGFILYGAGHNRLMDIRFDDCVFDSQNSAMIWSTHDWTTAANDNSTFIFNNCVFISTKTDPHVRFSSGDTVGRMDKVMFNNCSLQKVKFVSKINGNVNQGYDVQLIGCSPVEVEYDEKVTVRTAVRQYNPIPQST